MGPDDESTRHTDTISMHNDNERVRFIGRKSYHVYPLYAANKIYSQVAIALAMLSVSITDGKNSKHSVMLKEINTA